MGKLIEKEGRFYKECGVVMLDSTKETDIVLIGNILYPHKKMDNGISKYLYITSDDEIKEGDWFIANDGFRHDNPKYIIAKCEKVSDNGYKIYNNVGYADGYNAYKIIATTDSTIGYTDHRVSPVHNFCDYPKPSQSFILKYIEAYNKGEKIVFSFFWPSPPGARELTRALMNHYAEWEAETWRKRKGTLKSTVGLTPCR